MTRIQTFIDALTAIRKLAADHTHSKPIASAIEQLEYLIAVEDGLEVDRSRLDTINIGLIAVREIEGLDEDAAEKLHEAAFEARQMI